MGDTGKGRVEVEVQVGTEQADQVEEDIGDQVVEDVGVQVGDSEVVQREVGV